MPTSDSFLARVHWTLGCWYWMGRIDKQTGYGRLDKNSWAHRVAYELFVGPVPEGLEIDHLCRVKHCINPAHLEAVTHAENVRRGQSGAQWRAKTHCPAGHPYDEANTYVTPSRPNARYCRTCRAEDSRRRYLARK